MHIVLVGPGALGCLLSRFLHAAIDGATDCLTILDHAAPRAALLTSQGIIYRHGDQEERTPVVATADPRQPAAADVVLLCVKSYDVAASLDFCAPLLSPSSVLLFFQNGISHLQYASGAGASPTAFATTTEGATLLGPGMVRHAGSGMTSIGFLGTAGPRTSARIDNLCAIFRRAGLNVESTGRILPRLWAKLFINAAINGLTATLGCRNGELLSLPGVEERMRRIIDEAKAVAMAKQVEVMDDPWRAARIVCTRTADNISSMLQDVRRKRRTEIDAINGAVVEFGQRHGLKTEENLRIWREVKELEAGYL